MGCVEISPKVVAAQWQVELNRIVIDPIIRQACLNRKARKDFSVMGNLLVDQLFRNLGKIPLNVDVTLTLEVKGK